MSVFLEGRKGGGRRGKNGVRKVNGGGDGRVDEEGDGEREDGGGGDGGEREDVGDGGNGRVREGDEEEDGNKEGEEEGNRQAAVPGGKGVGGKWLFVSHTPIDLSSCEEKWTSRYLGLVPLIKGDLLNSTNTPPSNLRLARFQFEPMVCSLYILPHTNTKLNIKPLMHAKILG